LQHFGGTFGVIGLGFGIACCLVFGLTISLALAVITGFTSGGGVTC
jgi:hypothetical protein